ncbi:MAG: imidazole glycerol phosphate synthase subunit HisH [Desulfobaccales bacterium]|nr:imidazole glycerol phosphate synthase subunit HisH [Desulfobaccales bacterium]
MELAIIDLKNMGNIQSVLGAFQRVGATVAIVTSPEELERARAVVLPGVGAFGEGMASLKRLGLVQALKEHALNKQKPLLGICLGMQLLAEEGLEHGRHAGLGFLPGRVVPLPPRVEGCRIPNMGWCDVTLSRPDSRLFAATRNHEAFYFAHSFYFKCLNPGDVAATIDYGGPITAAVERGNLFGMQFHPEKSQEAGLDLLYHFCRHVRRHFGD